MALSVHSGPPAILTKHSVGDFYMRPIDHIIFYKKPILLVSMILILMTSLMLWNASDLKQGLARSTQAYVTDVSSQLTSDISARIRACEQSLEVVAGSVPFLPDRDTLEDFLADRAEILGLDALAVIVPDGGSVPQGFTQTYPGARSAAEQGFPAQPAVDYLEGQSLLFSVPVDLDHYPGLTLAGIRSKENVQALIQPRSYSGNGLTCIVDSTGTVVISPTDLKPFLQLDDLFQSGSGTKAHSHITQMMADMAARQSGVFQFTAADGNELFMSYHVLNVNDWFLLTLVPADLISGYADAYILRALLLIGGCVLAFGLLFLALFQFYRTNRRQLEAVAYTDPLTGGMNEAAFRLAYQKLVPGMAPHTHAVVLMDIKGFKLINENYGVSEGNKLLRYVHHTLTSRIQAGELAARANADQFLLCLRESGTEQIRARLDAMVAAVNAPDRPSEIRYPLTIPQGACLIDDPGADITLIEARARAACKLQGGKSVCSFYDADLMQRMKREQELNVQFPLSLANRDFTIHLQPKVYLRDGALGGAEALVRWNHPQLGLISPGDFIPLFERNDNICQLNLYVFEAVCATLRRWMDEGQPLVAVSVNLSRAHFKNPRFLDPLSRLKAQYRIPDGAIEIELTESTFFNERQRELVQASIREMHRRGFLCSLDDFGVGFSSLALLQEFDVDAIKLDRQFFNEITNPKGQTIIASFLSLAKKLGIHTVAEGIENQAQADYLLGVDCDMIQGYYFSKPLSIPEFEQWRLTRPPRHNPGGGAEAACGANGAASR